MAAKSHIEYESSENIHTLRLEGFVGLLETIKAMNEGDDVAALKAMAEVSKRLEK